MAEAKTIDQLPAKASLVANDMFPVDDGAQSYKIFFSVLLAAIPGLTGVALSQDSTSLVFTFRDGSTQTFRTTDPRKQDVLTFDATPTENSTNPVTSGGVYAADAGLDRRITDEADRARQAEQGNADAVATAQAAAEAAQRAANSAASAASAAQSTADGAASAASSAAAAVAAERQRAATAENALADAIDDLGLQVVNGKLCAVYNT
jgi:hypothetical protein